MPIQFTRIAGVTSSAPNTMKKTQIATPTNRICSPCARKITSPTFTRCRRRSGTASELPRSRSRTLPGSRTIRKIAVISANIPAPA